MRYINLLPSLPGTSSPTLLKKCVGSLTFHRELMNLEDICETGPTVYCPYPRRLESLCICRSDDTLSPLLFYDPDC